MYQVKYQYDHGTWVEQLSSRWMTEDQTKAQIKYLRGRNARNIRVIQHVDVTQKFK